MKLHEKLFSKDVGMVPARNGYGEALIELGSRDKRIVVCTADLADSTRVLEFAKRFPEQFVECGVAEQNMAGIAAGLALSGNIPFISSYAVFSPGRNWDQIRVSICYNNANVKIAGAHAGVSVGADGATHQALEDIAIMRTLPNMIVLAPCDYEQTKKATIAAASVVGPVYIRFARDASPCITTREMTFEIGKAQTLLIGSDVTLVACGQLLYHALVAAHELSRRGIACDVINNHTIKPLDAATLLRSAKKTRAVVTIEEHQIMCGMGSAVCELLAQRLPVPIEMVGVRDTFGESGQPAELLKKYGMSVRAIMKAAAKAVSRKN